MNREECGFNRNDTAYQEPCYRCGLNVPRHLREDCPFARKVDEVEGLLAKVKRLADAAHGLKVANRTATGDRRGAYSELLAALHDLEGGRRREIPCPECGGAKKVRLSPNSPLDRNCPRCRGTGLIEENEDEARRV